MRTPLHSLTWLLAWLLTATAAAAEPCLTYHQDTIVPEADGPAQVWSLLNNQRESGCILGRTDTTGIEERYQALLGDDLPPDERARIRTDLLTDLLAQFDGLPSRLCDGLEPDCVVGRQQQALRRLAADIDGGEALPEVQASLDAWFPQTFDGRMPAGDVVLADFLDQRCAAGVANDACADAVAITAKAMRAGLTVNQLIAAYRLPVIGVNEAFLSGRDRQWQTYLNEAPVQYPWELAVNGWRYQRATENRDQFPPAPDDQWVLLHPSPAAEAIDTPGGGRSTAAAIVVEVFGYQRWRWQDGERRNRWGVSAIVSLADLDGMDTVGYGAMLHTPLPHASLGVVWRDGDAGRETGIILSVDLAKLLQQYRNGDLLAFLGP